MNHENGVIQIVDDTKLNLEINMPDMDRFETCARLKSDPSTENIPVVFVTYRDDVSDICRQKSKNRNSG